LEIRLLQGEKNVTARRRLGDAYCFFVNVRTTKPVIARHSGMLSPLDALFFVDNLDRATSDQFQLTIDGYKSYPGAILSCFRE
jgi:hypothetical protein